MKLRILIDPGHGGKDSGAVGPAGTLEKDLNLIYSKKIYSILDASPTFDPSLTRDDDIYIRLCDRATKAITEKAHIFVSIHCNASVSQKPKDMQTYYYNAKKDKPLAQAIFSTTDKVDNVTSKFSRVIFGNFYVLRRLKDSNIPACLVEVAFLSNPNDEILLNNQEFQKEFCQEVVKGIRAFILLS